VESELGALFGVFPKKIVFTLSDLMCFSPTFSGTNQIQFQNMFCISRHLQEKNTAYLPSLRSCFAICRPFCTQRPLAVFEGNLSPLLSQKFNPLPSPFSCDACCMTYILFFLFAIFARSWRTCRGAWSGPRNGSRDEITLFERLECSKNVPERDESGARRVRPALCCTINILLEGNCHLVSYLSCRPQGPSALFWCSRFRFCPCGWEDGKAGTAVVLQQTGSRQQANGMRRRSSKIIRCILGAPEHEANLCND